LDKSELHKLQAFLQRTLGAKLIHVTPNPRDTDKADVHLGERKLGLIEVDDEDGDRSFGFSMKVPVDRATLQDYLQKLFDNPKLRIMGRLKKTDSVELNSGEDFVGIVSADDAKAASYTLQIAILDFDLEDV
jgi:Protein of unknown function (DUF3126)